ncbi:hypothetical protein [Aureispira anguillae]|uniref:Uncharacterized protein n=1 Tax=Aureispira anguillae TaxID=2864201 RepID=A0A915Y9W4_9BACT|nr:hypothetical protein [Aureispira anguillae]BDS09539.1 hypothetical protein AsAng_0002400 [Aureispira anguillae]
MTTILLIAFTYLFYQLLIKPVLKPTTVPNMNYRQMDENQNLMDMWRHLQQFQQEKKNRTESATRANATKGTAQKEGFQGGEYIDYEEL